MTDQNYEELEQRIRRLEGLVDENFQLAQEAGKLATKALKEIEGFGSDIESRLDDLEATEDQVDTWEPLDLFQAPRGRLVKIEDGQIGIYDTQNDKYHYWIELTRIKTHRDLLEWVHHLNGKVWVTKEVLDDFIEAVFSYRKWTLYKGA